VAVAGLVAGAVGVGTNLVNRDLANDQAIGAKVAPDPTSPSVLTL